MPHLFDKHKHAKQPRYDTPLKFQAREQIVKAYRAITGRESIPNNRGYWALCNRQPDSDDVEIVQLVECGLITKDQFYGIDYDLEGEGIIEFNRQQHPEANWFEGEWLEVIERNYESFKPALVHLDCTSTVITLVSHLLVARTMNMCPSGTVLAANLMLSDGRSRRRFDPNILIQSLGMYLREPNDWDVGSRYYSYKASRTEMATYIFTRK